MKFKVKSNCPTIIFVNGIDYTLYPNTEIDLPDNDHEHIKTLIALNYLEPIEPKKSKAEVKDNAS